MLSAVFSAQSLLVTPVPGTVLDWEMMTRSGSHQGDPVEDLRAPGVALGELRLRIEL
jgi:hypothetical protein